MTAVTVVIPSVVGTAVVLSASGRAFPLRSGFQPLDGQVNLAVVQPDHHDLYILTLRQMLVDVTDIGI